MLLQKEFNALGAAERIVYVRAVRPDEVEGAAAMEEIELVIGDHGGYGLALEDASQVLGDGGEPVPGESLRLWCHQLRRKSCGPS